MGDAPNSHIFFGQMDKHVAFDVYMSAHNLAADFARVWWDRVYAATAGHG